MFGLLGLALTTALLVLALTVVLPIFDSSFFRPQPDSIPIHWQWFALVFGSIGSVVGIVLAGVALFMLKASQPAIDIWLFERGVSPTERQLFLTVRNLPVTTRSWAAKLGVRRQPTNLNIVYSIQNRDTGEMVGAHVLGEQTLHPSLLAPEHLIALAAKRPNETIYAVAFLLGAEIRLAPGTYSTTAAVNEGGHSYSVSKDFAVDAEDLSAFRWL